MRKGVIASAVAGLFLLSACGSSPHVRDKVSSSSSQLSVVLESSALGEKVNVKVVPFESAKLDMGENLVLGTDDDYFVLSELVADLQSTPSQIVFAARDIASEHQLSPELTELILDKLQTAVIKLYEKPSNPPTGGLYYDLLAYDHDNRLYLHLRYNGEWLIAKCQENTPKIFDGSDSKFQEIDELIKQ